MRYEIPKQIPAFAYEIPHLPTLLADSPELEDMPDIACSKGDGLLKPVMHLKLDYYALDVSWLSKNEPFASVPSQLKATFRPTRCRETNHSST